jgi:cytochrome c oxidase subunit 2
MVLIRKLIAITAALYAASLVVTGLSLADENARGRQLYELCAQCHGSAAQGTELYLAPAIAGLDEWYVISQLNVFKSGARGLNYRDVGGMRMHPMSLWLKTDGDVQAVASYVASMPKVNPPAVVQGGNPANGKTLYATCSACHGQAGEGNKSMNSPPLSHMSDWYLVSTLQKFKEGIRGGNPANTNAVLMRGMANMLTTDQAIKDVVAYISTLK